MPPDTRPLPRLTSRPDVQGLRALAVVLVILDHAGVPWFRGGFVGVDVFFVISGFLISSLLLHEATTTGRVRIGHFYARRARRILPAATLVLVATSAFAAWQLSVTRVQEIVQDVRWAAFFAANIHFSRLGTDYFEQDRAESPVQHFWSLAVEEQFYLFWPVLLLLVCLVVRHRQVRAVTALVAFAWLASLAWSIVLTPASSTQAYFSSATRVWELATGALLALAGPVLRQLTLGARRVFAVGGLAAIAVAAVRYDASTLFPGWRALLPVLGTAAVLAAGVRGPVGPARVLTLRPIRYVGDISYSLYLWHWPVLVLGAEYVGASPSPVETCLLVLVAVLLSVLSYHAVENPFRHARGWALRGRRALTLWPVALAMVVVTSGYAAAYSTNAFEARIAGPTSVAPVANGSTESQPSVSAEEKVVAPRQPPIRERLAAALRQVDTNEPIPFPVVNLKGLDRDAWHVAFRCYSSWGEGGHRLCPLGDTHAKRSVVVYGDSHAGMWLTALDRLGAQTGYRVIPLIKVGCGPFDVEQWRRKKPFPDCPPYRDWALKQIKRINPDVILLGYRGLLGVHPPPDETEGQAWSAGVSSTVRRMTRLAPRVIVMSDVATLDFQPGDCLTDPDSTMSSCVGREHAVVHRANRITRRAAQPLGARFVDLTGLVCLRNRCPLIVDHVVTFRDASHLSVTWVKMVAPDLGRLLKL
ncbi:MAG: acyltransferase family protein [Nocardioidaceae bacterium]